MLESPGKKTNEQSQMNLFMRGTESPRGWKKLVIFAHILEYIDEVNRN